MGKEEILIVYYLGAYGPTIIININTDEMMTKFYNVMESVKKEGTINLGELSFIKFKDISSLKLIYQKRHVGKSVLIDKQSNVTWLFDEWHWDNCLGLSERFLEGLPGHHYLSEEGYDDALIELSFKENLRTTK